MIERRNILFRDCNRTSACGKNAVDCPTVILFEGRKKRKWAVVVVDSGIRL